MRLRFLLAVAVCLAPAAGVRAELPAVRLGSIFIVGNESTPQGTILRLVDICPGEEFTDADLRRFERNLARLSWLFVVDKDNRPQVYVNEPEKKGAFKDVVVKIKERPLTPYIWKTVDYVEETAWRALRYPRLGLLTAIPGSTYVPDRVIGTSVFIVGALCQGNPESAYQALIMFAYSPWGLLTVAR